MASELRLDFLQGEPEYVGKNRYEIADDLVKKYGYIAIVQYESMGTYFGCCRTIEELEEVLGSSYCKQREIIYHIPGLKDSLLALEAKGILKYSVPSASRSPRSTSRPAPVSQSLTAGMSQGMGAAVQKYLSMEYTLVSRADKSVVLRRQAPINWFILIGLLFLFPVGIIIYLLVRRKYQVQLIEEADGQVSETGGTLAEFESDRAREARRPKSGYILVILGGLLAMLTACFSLILFLSYSSDPALSDRMGTMLMVLLVCGGPLFLVSLLMAGGGGLLLHRANRMPLAPGDAS